MHVHFVGVAGTGMGTLAGLFRAAGHRVSGSDVLRATGWLLTGGTAKTDRTRS